MDKILREVDRFQQGFFDKFPEILMHDPEGEPYDALYERLRNVAFAYFEGIRIHRRRELRRENNKLLEDCKKDIIKFAETFFPEFKMNARQKSLLKYLAEGNTTVLAPYRKYYRRKFEDIIEAYEDKNKIKWSKDSALKGFT